MKLRKFNVVAAVKAASRLHIGIVPATRFAPANKHKRNPKHRQTLARIMREAQ